MEQLLLLLGAGLLAGTMNAAAGGGSFVTLPALVFAGVPSVAANASSTVALFPGSLASAWAYRDDFKGFNGMALRTMLGVSLAGGCVGALLLLATPQATFDALVPWLLLLGTLAFAFGRHAGARLRRRFRVGPPVLLGAQFLLAVYGGYFGGAVGIMMMAVWSLLDLADVRAMNATKVAMVAATNTVAVLCFVAAGQVWWAQTCAVLGAALIGGYGGARIARRVPPHQLHIGITAFNIAMTAVFFMRAFR